MEPEKGLTFNSFDEFKDCIQTWAVTKKFTPRVLKKDSITGCRIRGAVAGADMVSP
jgi:hypothetical protein